MEYGRPGKLEAPLALADGLLFPYQIVEELPTIHREPDCGFPYSHFWPVSVATMRELPDPAVRFVSTGSCNSSRLTPQVTHRATPTLLADPCDTAGLIAALFHCSEPNQFRRLH